MPRSDDSRSRISDPIDPAPTISTAPRMARHRPKEAPHAAVPAGDDDPDRRLRRQEEAGEGRAVPDGPDARAAPRLQPDLHRLRADPRVRVDDQAEALDPGMPRRRRRVRRPGRLDLRRRADDLPRDRRADGQDPRAEEGRLPLHQRHVHPQEDRRLQALEPLLLQRPPRRDEEVARPGRRARGGLRPGDRRDQGRQGGRPHGLHQHDGLHTRPTWPSSTPCSPT